MNMETCGKSGQNLVYKGGRLFEKIWATWNEMVTFSEDKKTMDAFMRYFTYLLNILRIHSHYLEINIQYVNFFLRAFLHIPFQNIKWELIVYISTFSNGTLGIRGFTWRTPNTVFSVTYCMKLHNAIIYLLCVSQFTNNRQVGCGRGQNNPYTGSLEAGVCWFALPVDCEHHKT